ncbi:hypothetical protein D3C77_705850 [compost metagenome]
MSAACVSSRLSCSKKINIAIILMKPGNIPRTSTTVNVFLRPRKRKRDKAYMLSVVKMVENIMVKVAIFSVFTYQTP